MAILGGSVQGHQNEHVETQAVLAALALEAPEAVELPETRVLGSLANVEVLPWEALEAQALAKLENHEEAVVVAVHDEAVQEDALEFLFREDDEPLLEWSTWS